MTPPKAGFFFCQFRHLEFLLSHSIVGKLSENRISLILDQAIQPSCFSYESAMRFERSHRSELNRRPAVYETAALPLSYGGVLVT